MARRLLFAVLSILTLAALPAAADADTTAKGNSTKWDLDGNGIPDAGKIVTGHYQSVYAYDDAGDYYWDLGDGRVQGTVASVESLDQETLTVCNYQVTYRGDFGNTSFLDSGWIQNAINCSGYDDNGSYTYLIVHESDPRFTGTGIPEYGGTWEYHVLTESGEGNTARPRTGPNA